MLHTLCRKSKAAKVSGVQEDLKACTLPIWARNSQWMSVAKELAGYASPLNRAWGDGVSDLSSDFSLKSFGFNKGEMWAVAVFGLHFLHALHIESEKREKAELERDLLKEQLAVASKKKETASKAKDRKEGNQS